MLVAGLVTQCGLTPGGHRAGTTDGRTTLTTTVGVIAGVHNGTADGGTDTHVTGAAGFTDIHILVIDVAYLTDGSHAVELNVAQLAAGQTLPERNRDHALTGDYIGFRECHIRPDWLLVYRVDGDALELFLFRTGTHTDLFD